MKTKRLTVLVVLALALAGTLAAPALAQSTASSQYDERVGPDGGGRDVDCSQLGSSPEQVQGQAQAILDRDPSDPNGLDADGDGVACEVTEEASGKVTFEDGTFFVSDGVASPEPDPSPPALDVVVSDNGRVTIDGDVQTDCRSFALAVEDGYTFGLTPEQKQDVLNRCEQLGLLSSDDTPTASASASASASATPAQSPQPAPTKASPASSPEPSASPTAPAEEGGSASAATGGELPETGGASPLALGASVLLIVGGLVARRVVR